MLSTFNFRRLTFGCIKTFQTFKHKNFDFKNVKNPKFNFHMSNSIYVIKQNKIVVLGLGTMMVFSFIILCELCKAT